MALTHIKDFIAQKREAGQDLTDLSQDLGVSISSIHYYAKGENKPSLVTAVAIYRKYEIAIHPFSEESLQWEIDNDKR